MVASWSLHGWGIDRHIQEAQVAGRVVEGCEGGSILDRVETSKRKMGSGQKPKDPRKPKESWAGRALVSMKKDPWTREGGLSRDEHESRQDPA